MQGAIPIEIAHLTQLQDLDLTNTALSDIRHLESLSALNRLSIGKGCYVREVPHNIDTFPRSLPALKHIRLSSQDLVEMIPVLQQCQDLTIQIMGGDISTDVALLSKLQNLRSLTISNSSIVNLDALVNLQSLKSLHLYKNYDVLDLDSIFQIKSLQCLEISNNPDTPIPDRFHELPNLTHVILRYMKLKELPETLVRHPNLHTLNPNDNYFSSSYGAYLEKNCSAYANRPIGIACE